MDGQRAFRNSAIFDLRRARVQRDNTSVCVGTCVHGSARSHKCSQDAGFPVHESEVNRDIRYPEDFFLSVLTVKKECSQFVFMGFSWKRKRRGCGTPDTSTDISQNQVKALRVTYWQGGGY